MQSWMLELAGVLVDQISAASRRREPSRPLRVQRLTAMVTENLREERGRTNPRGKLQSFL